ncbi:unnamed protein product [Heterobilharzia americana]|nr:unnamed protein product [Heterobilharzia americana]
MSHKLEDLQAKTNKLIEEEAKTGFQVNIEKTEVMKTSNQQQTPITISGRNLKEVTSFTYLGSTVSTTGGTGTDEDVKVRIGKARQAFISLKPVWRSSALSMWNKIRIFNTNFSQVSASVWFRDMARYEGISNKLQTFINNCLRSLLKIRWPE